MRRRAPTLPRPPPAATPLQPRCRHTASVVPPGLGLGGTSKCSPRRLLSGAVSPQPLKKEFLALPETKRKFCHQRQIIRRILDDNSHRGQSRAGAVRRAATKRSPHPSNPSPLPPPSGRRRDRTAPPPTGFPSASEFPSRWREGCRSRTRGCRRRLARAASQPCPPSQRISRRPRAAGNPNCALLQRARPHGANLASAKPEIHRSAFTGGTAASCPYAPQRVQGRLEAPPSHVALCPNERPAGCTGSAAARSNAAGQIQTFSGGPISFAFS